LASLRLLFKFEIHETGWFLNSTIACQFKDCFRIGEKNNHSSFEACKKVENRISKCKAKTFQMVNNNG